MNYECSKTSLNLPLDSFRFLQLSGDGSPASGVPGTTPFIHRDTNFFLLQGR